MAVDLDEVTYLVGQVRCDMCGLSMEWDDEGCDRNGVLDHLEGEGWDFGESRDASALCPDCAQEELDGKEREPARHFAGRELYTYKELGVEPYDLPEGCTKETP